MAVLSFGSVAAAVLLQHLADMQPCIWCVLQRLIYLLVGAAALLALASRAVLARRLGSVAGIAFALAGLAAALWQQFVASKSQSCNLTLADRIIRGLSLDELMPWMFKATAYCDEANIPLLGVPFALWSAALFCVLAVLLAAALLRRPAQTK